MNARPNDECHEAFWKVGFTAPHELFIDTYYHANTPTLDSLTNQNGDLPVGFVRDSFHVEVSGRKHVRNSS